MLGYHFIRDARDIIIDNENVCILCGKCIVIVNTIYYICVEDIKVYNMAQSTLSMRVDDNLKKNFDMICDDFGFTSTAAITVFMKTVVRERRIPFEIKASSKEQINKDAWNAFLEMRNQVAAAGAQGLSLEEINAEIRDARNER